MANPPPRINNGKHRQKWMCPNHADHELLALGHSSKGYANRGKAHKVRKAKNAKVVDTSLKRGFTNNGLIEIENEPSDSETEDYQNQWDFSTVFRLPERGVKLDFIDKVKR
jgi:hypothetical protein